MALASFWCPFSNHPFHGCQPCIPPVVMDCLSNQPGIVCFKNPQYTHVYIYIYTYIKLKQLDACKKTSFTRSGVRFLCAPPPGSRRRRPRPGTSRGPASSACGGALVFFLEELAPPGFAEGKPEGPPPQPFRGSPKKETPFGAEFPEVKKLV